MCLVAGFVAGVLVGVCDGAACGLRGLALPTECGLWLLVRVWSARYYTVCAGCAVFGGVVVHHLSAPPGAEANALADMA